MQPGRARAGGLVGLGTLVELIRSLGFEVGWIDEEGGRVLPYAGPDWSAEYVNLVCRRV